MYEELNQPIPDIAAYLIRIGMEAPDLPDLPYLNRLIYAHHTHIPFEDLDSAYFRKAIPLDIPSLYEKIVVKHRGGYCYEMNALFTRLLLDLHYRARSVFCRIIRGRDFIPPCTHRGIVVEVNGALYFCDVGYGGPMPAGAIRIEDGYEEMVHEEFYRIDRYDDYWWMLSRRNSEGNLEKILHFNTFPQIPAEFLAANLKAYSDPASIFVTKLLVNLRTDTGSLALTGDELTIRDEEGSRSIRVEDDNSLRDILKTYFGILL